MPRVNAIVGLLAATDPDANSSFSFRLPAGFGNSSTFIISGTSLRTIMVTLTDGDGGISNQPAKSVAVSLPSAARLLAWRMPTVKDDMDPGFML